MQYTTLRSGRTAAQNQPLKVSRLCLGTMFMGTRTDEQTSFAILDRFVEAGGTFLDTANNYNAWIGGHGRDSEELLGRWLADRGVRDQLVLATKCGAARRDRDRPLSWDNLQGLAPATVREEVDLSRKALGTDHIDVFYGHVDDRDTPLDEIVGAFGALAADGVIGLPGISNVTTWRVALARERAAARGLPGFGIVQQHGSYAYPRPEATTFVTPDLLDYATSEDIAVVAYSPLQQGAYERDGVYLRNGMDNPSTHHRIAVVREVAARIGATPNQVVLAWLMGGPVPIIPVFGASSVAQLDESLAAADLVLDDETRALLDAA